MNIDELWDYLQLQNSMFTDKFIGIISSNNKFYSIEIKNGLWIHCPSWASTLKTKEDFGCVKFPVRLHLEELPPYECLIDLWKANNTQERLGQWFYNKHLNTLCSTKLYEETDVKLAYQMIFDTYYAV